MKPIALTLCIVLWLVGCIPQPVQQSITPSIELTSTLPATTTKIPSASSTKTILPTITPTHISTSTRTPIPSPTEDLAATVVAAQKPSLYASYPSPDGLWRTDVLIYNCIKVNEGGDETALEQLHLVNLVTGDERLVDTQLQYCGGLGAYGFEGRFWSPDSNYFYYTTARLGVPDGCGFWEPPLSRFDLANLRTEFLGMGTQSPDGEKIATWDTSFKELVIRDINDGEIARFPAFSSDAGIGPITWLPDSQSLVYLQVNSWCPLAGKSYLVEADLLSTTQTLLLESEKPTFSSVEWADSDEIKLFDENGKEWRFNLDSKELTQSP